LKDNLLELGAHIIKYAEKLDSSQSEAYLESSRILEVKIEKGTVQLAAEKYDTGCGIRVAIGNQIGVSYVTSLLAVDLDQAVDDAISAAKASVPDPDFRSFVSTRKLYPSIKGLIDKNIAQIDCDSAVDLIARAVGASQEVSGKERNLIDGVFTAEMKTRAVTNSFGISISSSDTTTHLEISSTIGTGDDKCSSWEDYSSRKIAEINPEKIGEQSARNALDIRGGKFMEGGDLPLILTPRALSTLLGKGLVPAFSAREIQDGKSYLVDSLGAQIANPVVEIIDSGITPKAVGSHQFDAEGIPTQETPLISKGVLRSHLHDSYSSAKDSVESTGNSFRSSYRVAPRIDATNIIVTPGTSALDDMISDMKKGVICTFTFDRPNSVTGELSAMIMEGFFVSKGEIQHALKNTLFGVTMQDLMKRATIVGSEVESRGNVITPPIFIDSVNITSG